ncbi:Hpt domain-containing protein [Rhodoferax saidenbachensis]|uniref:Chemotaxis protein CheA n=1 Tax=Rhodoferax saidenbachensis TaxID=1484693 RepID=A0A1P8KDH4_9BURK|nr:Hpt domain-containing protein [Rhodoferax saidenbachensis]APW44035.1 hybrid sensor histidine kinase/response regulator [Rhodoferax saidenbachensis]
MSSNPAASADNELAVNDLGPLAWVLDELRKSLEGATKAMRRFVRDAELARGSDLTELDASHLRIARQQLHQAVGALEMVGLGAPAKVLLAMEAVAQKYVQRPELCSDDAAAKIERASFALTEYLEGVLKGKSASSVALFPQYRAVQELAGADRIHPADLWPVEWRWVPLPLQQVEPLAYAPELRSQMDRLVLKWVKTGDAAAAKRMASLCSGLAQDQKALESRSFWTIAEAFFEAASKGLSPADVYTKRAASRVLQQYATLARGEPDISERLAQDLLFFCSLSAPAEDQSVPALRAVRAAYGLNAPKVVDYETEQFGRFDPALLVLARKRIASAAETWSALAGGDTNRLKVAAEQFASVADSVVKLHPESSALALALNQAIDATLRSGAAPAPAVAMEVATAVLYLEAAYEDMDPTDSHMADRSGRLALRLQHVIAGAESEPMEAWMEELYRRVSDRQTMGSVVDELRTTLGEVEKSLDQFFRSPQDKTPLREVPSQLAQMRGVFSVLGLDQPSLAALRMRASVEQFLVDDVDEATARTGIFEKLGSSLGAMGFLIDMLSYQRTLAKKLFIYDEELGEFKPLMGRERVAAPEPVAIDFTADTTVLLTPRPAPVPEVAPAAVVAPEIAVPVAVADPGPVTQATEDDDGSELRDIFLEEAREVVHNGLAAVKALAVDPSNLAEQTTLRRAFHTLKGSSRMVGLNEFGEAAWSFEQLLNTWLAEQRPASDELITLSTSAMLAFGRWVEDIAADTGVEWDAQNFRNSSDGLRLNGELVLLHTPGEPEVVELPPASDAVPDEVESFPEVALAADVVDEELQPDFVSTEMFDEEEPAAPAPVEFASTQLVNSLDFGVEPPKPDFASTQLVDSLDFGSAAPRTEFASTQLIDGLLPSLDEKLPDFEMTRTASFERTQAIQTQAADHSAEDLRTGVEVQDVALEDFDFGDLDFPAADAAPQASLDHLEVPPVADASSEPAADAQGAAEEQVKVIGSLRLSIPLYNVYLNEADEWSRRLQTELSEWGMELHRTLPDTAVALAHSLLGSSATVGFTALSEMARSLEQALQHVQLHQQGSPEVAQVFNNAAEDIRRLLHQFAAGFLKESDESIMAALQAITETEFPAPSLETAPQEEDVSSVIELEAQDTEAPVTEALDTEVPVQVEAVEEIPVAIPVMAPVATAAPLHIAQGLDEDIDAQDNLDEDLFPIFEEEAAELLPQLGTALRQWVAHPDNMGARSEILRVLHTLKGSARLAGAMRLGEMSHRMESSIEQVGTESLQSVQLEPLLAGFDTLQAAFAALGAAPAEEDAAAQVVAPTSASAPASGSAPSAATTTAIKLPAPVMTHAPVRQTANQSIRVRSQLLDRLVNQAGEVMITRSRMDARLSQLRSSLDELGGNLDRLRQQLRDVELQAESQMQSRLAQTKDSAQAFDPLEFDRFTRVQELTRMMAESVNDVATVQRNLQRSVEGAEDDLIAQGRQARELQRDLLRTRMVEFEGISDRLYGVVRQAAKDAGKQVKLDIVGGSIDMDRGVLDRMTPAFEHMLRNAVAHGIESAAVRGKAEKPTAGTITIHVNQESNDVSVAFSDDGGGLHLDKIREKALANGVIQAGDVLSDDEAANLIFMPGFSTAEQVTELSGRGIGMDVVRSEVNALGGRIETTTKPGQGSTFKLVLPLTTAVTQVVMLRMGEFTIGVPSNLMETVLRVPASTLEQAYQPDGFDMGAERIPFFWAGALLQVSSRSHEAPTKTLPVAVFRSAGQRLAMHVDEVLGNREVVVKNLGPQLARLPGLAGMSVLASGAVVLIYNPVALASVYGDQARQLRLSSGNQTEATLALADSQNPALMGGMDLLPLVLVVDDSITVRRVTQRLLKREGYRVALAADGLQALEKLQEEKPAVVLSDIEMPRMDGFDLARNIRGDEKLRDLPIIMITSRIAEKHREHARELGVDHYLGKPYSEDELLGLVRSYCSTPVES